MYLLWSRGFDDITFPMLITTNSSVKRTKRAAHAHAHVHNYNQMVNDGMLMAQLLRADKLEIPERLTLTNLMHNTPNSNVQLNYIQLK